MPEVQHPAILTTSEPRAVHDVGLAFDERTYELRILRRIVFEIGVLNQHDFARAGGQPGADGCAFALIAVVKNDA